MKMKLWEKIFIICNIIVILSIIGIYISRAVKYYKITNVIKENSKLVEILEKKVIYNGDGLYKEEENYYFKGKNVDNYVLYNNILYRIIGFDDNGIKLITNDTPTTLIYGTKDNYADSNIYNYLNNNYLNILNKEELVKSSWCNSNVDVNKYECTNNIDDYIGLISSKEYLNAGGKDSYLNNNTYFWLINSSLDNSKLYVNNEGTINNNYKNENDYYSYGVRPVIVLPISIQNYKGDGSIEKPYVLSSNSEIMISNHSVGTYVKIGEYTFRIISKEDEYTRLLLDSNLDKLSYNDAIKFINNEFISNIDSEILVKGKCYSNSYNIGNNYNLKNENETTAYACLPNIGDLFISEYDGIWLNTKYNNSLIYTISGSSIFADLKSSTNNVRPIINVKNELIISSGEGTKNNPLVVGGIDETNN